MHWKDLESDMGAGWAGLEILVETRDVGSVPALHMEAGQPMLMRLMVGSTPVLWARVAEDYWGYWYCRRQLEDAPSSLILPRMTALEARSVDGPANSPEWWRRWARTFADQLVRSPSSPLYPACWWLLPLSVGSSNLAWNRSNGLAVPSVPWLGKVIAQPAVTFQEWDMCDDLEPLALRPLSEPSDARVKSWRRSFREGTMPPVLMMWVSGLHRFVILDGHDRLMAALAEEAVPPVLGLFSVRTQSCEIDLAQSAEIERRLAAHLLAAQNPDLRPPRPLSVATANRVLLEAYDSSPLRTIATRAWPLQGGTAVWRNQLHDLGPACGGDTAQTLEKMIAV